MAGTRTEYVFMARLSEQAERYEDMVEYMKRVTGMGSELSLDERNLLSVGYKNSVGARRSAWRAVHTMEQREAGRGPDAVALIADYRGKIESELNRKCLDVLELLDGSLIPGASNDEAKVFYLKMKGDYYRYLAEFASSDKQPGIAQSAREAYEAASTLAEASLPSTHPIRLGLALNFSVFYYEVLGDPSKACSLAKTSFDNAIANTDMPEDQHKDSSAILQLLRDNLTLWTDQQAGDGKPPEQDGTNVEEL
uniref:14-3-3 domain-containing protein n=1 Tax=Alexandrium monilatum TaxID=311494 RepID=A0A7S4V5G1_9DINO|mmetsp:Transcript_59262/g.176294  ORF Transcript_59262/g.176294 Transcript_59262/m.176294 type:complete len:252 (-) Transcript_59262:148-903(-)